MLKPSHKLPWNCCQRRNEEELNWVIFLCCPQAWGFYTLRAQKKKKLIKAFNNCRILTREIYSFSWIHEKIWENLIILNLLPVNKNMLKMYKLQTLTRCQMKTYKGKNLNNGLYLCHYCIWLKMNLQQTILLWFCSRKSILFVYRTAWSFTSFLPILINRLALESRGK